jgi:hypothetical protein
MQFEVKTYLGDVQILKRAPFEGIAKTLDFSGVDAVNGVKTIKAGTPISSAGAIANSSSAFGILLFDVTDDRPQGTLVTKGYINTSVAEAHAGITYDSGAKSALKNVIFE